MKANCLAAWGVWTKRHPAMDVYACQEGLTFEQCLVKEYYVRFSLSIHKLRLVNTYMNITMNWVFACFLYISIWLPRYRPCFLNYLWQFTKRFSCYFQLFSKTWNLFLIYVWNSVKFTLNLIALGNHIVSLNFKIKFGNRSMIIF